MTLITTFGRASIAAQTLLGRARWTRRVSPSTARFPFAARDGEVGGDDVRGTVARVADGELPEIMPG